VVSEWEQFKELRHEKEHDVGIGIWMQWDLISVGNGKQVIEWDEGEKFYEADRWMAYMIEHFVESHGSVANGVVYAQGEESEDLWVIVVNDNVVQFIPGQVVYPDEAGTILYEPTNNESDEW